MPGSPFSKVSIFSVTVVLNPLLSDWFVKVKKQGRIALSDALQFETAIDLIVVHTCIFKIAVFGVLICL